MTDQPNQLSRAELRNMRSDEITQALREGRLVEVLAGRDPGQPPTGADQGARGPDPSRQPNQLSRADLDGLSAEEINQARREGRLADLGVR